MEKVTHEVRCEQWTQIIKECLASGMNKTACCKAHGFSVKSFFYWQRILRNETYNEQKQLPALKNQKPETPVAFIELQAVENTASCTTGFCQDVIIRKNDLIMEVSNTASAGLLASFGELLHVK